MNWQSWTLGLMAGVVIGALMIRIYDNFICDQL